MCQHGQGIQHTYKMDKKPKEHQFQVKNQPQQRMKLKDEPKMGGYGNMKEMVKKQEAEYCKKRHGTKENIPGSVIP